MKILVLFFTAFFAISCSTNNPSYVSKDYIKAIQEDDIRRAKMHVYVPASIEKNLSKEELDKEIEKQILSLKSGIDDIKSCEVIKTQKIGKLVTKVFMQCNNKDEKIVDKDFSVIELDKTYKIILNL